jgi:hypothetical protein
MRRLANHRECLWKEIIQRLSGKVPSAKLCGPISELLVGQGTDFSLQIVDFIYERLEFLQLLLWMIAEDAVKKAKHDVNLPWRQRRVLVSSRYCG